MTTLPFNKKVALRPLIMYKNVQKSGCESEIEFEKILYIYERFSRLASVEQTSSIHVFNSYRLFVIACQSLWFVKHTVDGDGKSRKGGWLWRDENW